MKLLLCVCASMWLAAAAPAAEVRRVDGVRTTEFTTVALANTYTSPVVVCMPQYTSAATSPAVARVRNAGPTSFQVMAGLATASPTDDVYGFHCVIVEAGVYTAATDGVTMEARVVGAPVRGKAGLYNLPSNTALGNTYTAPVVLAQVTTFTDARFQVAYACAGSYRDPPSPSAVRIGRSVGEAGAAERDNDAVGFIVFEAGQGVLPGTTVPFTALVSPDAIVGVKNGNPVAVGYDSSDMPAGKRVVVATTAGIDGNDGGWPVLVGDAVADSTVGLAVDEDQLGDTERFHTTEQLAVVVFGADGTLSGGGGGDGTADDTVVLSGSLNGVVVRTIKEVSVESSGRRLRGASSAVVAALRALAEAGGSLMLEGSIDGVKIEKPFHVDT